MNSAFSEEPAVLTADIHQVLAQNAYDYIIIGGGTAGLLLANRLSEDAKTTVLVLEAGRHHGKDDLIDKPENYPNQLNVPSHDWIYKTVIQTRLNNRSISWNRGKGLGGSSNLNFMHWTRPTKVDIENWERLGNTGWTWDNLLPYFRRLEKFHQETESLLTTAHLPHDPSWFGRDGEIPLIYAQRHTTGIPEIRKIFEDLGIPSVKHFPGGSGFGLVTPIFSVDPETKTRASSYTSFLRPVLTRPNLYVLSEAMVTRLIIKENSHESPTSVIAEGVEFIHAGQTYRINAQREVILCAGAIKSPHILELSGIGDREVLSKAGIDVKLHLPGVGANLQEQTFIRCVSYEMKDYPQPSLDAWAESLQGSAIAWAPLQTITAKSEEIISQLVPKHLSELTSSDVLENNIKEQHHILAECLSNPSIPDCEITVSHRFGGYVNAPKPGKRYLTCAFGGVRPWSRGSIHTKSRDPFESPEIDPRNLEQEIDLEILLAGVKFLRELGNNPGLGDIIAEEVNPGPTIMTDEDIKDHIRKNMITFYHSTGTLAMLPREKGGVVDPTLKVWGTENIRVVDLSVVPIVVSVHTQCTTYVIAEVAADIIRGRITKL